MTSIPAPWVAEPEERDSAGKPWPNGRWRVVGRSMVDRNKPGAVVAVCLSEEDARLIASVHAMRDALEQIEEEAGENADVVDGPDGQPLPDRCMRIQITALEGLDGLGRLP